MARFVLADGTGLEVRVADTFRRRLVGLAWLAEPPELGLLIPRCDSVHTVGMRFAIDVIFITWPPPDGRLARVLDLRSALRPLRAASLPAGGRSVRRSQVATLELGAGRAESLGLAAGIELSHAGP